MAPLLLPSPSPPYPKPPPPPPLPIPNPTPTRLLCRCSASRRDFTIHTAIAAASALSSAAAADDEAPSPPRKSSPPLAGIANTRSWFQFFGSGFSIRVPPSFDDVMEPEDYSAGTTYYGDKAKSRPYAARFASPDRSELVSVVIKPSSQLKITFLEAKDITDLGTLKEASKIFVPGGAKLYSARTIRVKDEDDIRTYYFYEFGVDTQHVALMATVNSGKAYIAGSTAPQAKWEDDGVKLRSAAMSLSVS